MSLYIKYGIGLIVLIATISALLLNSWSIDTANYPINTASPYILPLTNDVLCVQSNNTLSTHKGKFQYSYDFWAWQGTDIHAARSGIVIYIRQNKSTIGLFEGNNVRIRHSDGTVAVYGHLLRNSVIPQIGDSIYQNEIIAKSGWNGKSLYPHIHFHVEKNGISIPIVFGDLTEDLGIPRFFKRYKTMHNKCYE